MKRVKRTFLGVGLALCAMLALAACGGNSGALTGSSSSSLGGTSGSTSASSQAKQVLQQIQTEYKNGNLKNANVTIDATGQSPLGTFTTASQGKMTLKPNFGANLNTTAHLGNNLFKTNEILTNGKAYVKQQGTNTWQEINLTGIASAGSTSSSNGSSIMQNLPAISLQNLTNFTNAHVIGQQQINGKPAVGVAGTVMQTINGQKVSYNETLWAYTNGSGGSSANYKPARITIGGAGSSSGSTSSSNTQGHLTVTFNNWNSGISINAPTSNVQTHTVGTSSGS